jgi:hypothetical protein
LYSAGLHSHKTDSNFKRCDRKRYEKGELGAWQEKSKMTAIRKLNRKRERWVSFVNVAAVTTNDI